MYLKEITLKNVGPVEHAHLMLPFSNNLPKPVILVGRNGSGKSLLLAHIINSLVLGHQEVYDDGEVESGKVYKYRNRNFIKSGASISYSSITFESGAKVEEIQLNTLKKSYENVGAAEEAYPIFNQIPPESNSRIMLTFREHPGTAEQLFKQQCCLYFPVNRFEDPAWLNQESLTTRTNYSAIKKIQRKSDRPIVAYSPLKSNRDWLLDVILDRQLYEMITRHVEITDETGLTQKVEILDGYTGPITKLFDAANKILRLILNEGENVRFGVSTRHVRQIAVMKNEKEWIPNLFQLSTGELQLFNLFITMLRDYDFSEGQFSELSEVTGIVVVDEIDSHLHTSLKTEALPELIACFPKVQFIITSHSPLFLLGLKKRLGSDGFATVSMPDGQPVAVEDFSEIGAAYEALKESDQHILEIKRILTAQHLPILYVEGDYDIRYLKKAAQILDRSSLLEKIIIRDGDGCGNLDKIWRSHDNPTNSSLPQDLILLYDCDVKKDNSERGRVFRRFMPTNDENPIKIGIENLFPPHTITKIENVNPQFIDIIEATRHRKRGESHETPEVKSVNKDEKRNMCDWLCQHGTKEDFANFSTPLDIIQNILERR